ncbi:MAG: DUF4389 domain-containing protein, partial [Kiritimatiellia bacterium]
ADGTGPKAEGKAQCKRVRKGPRPATVTPAAELTPAVEVTPAVVTPAVELTPAVEVTAAE